MEWRKKGRIPELGIRRINWNGDDQTNSFHETPLRVKQNMLLPASHEQENRAMTSAAYRKTQTTCDDAQLRTTRGVRIIEDTGKKSQIRKHGEACCQWILQL